MWMSIANDIAARIEDGTYTEHQRLPNERELAEQYGAARETVRKAIRELRERGLIFTVTGKGHYIGQPPED